MAPRLLALTFMAATVFAVPALLNSVGAAAPLKRDTHLLVSSAKQQALALFGELDRRFQAMKGVASADPATLQELVATRNRIKSALDGTYEVNDELSFQLQMWMDSMTKLLQALSNFAKAQQQTQQGIIGNMK